MSLICAGTLKSGQPCQFKGKVKFGGMCGHHKSSTICLPVTIKKPEPEPEPEPELQDKYISFMPISCMKELNLIDKIPKKWRKDILKKDDDDVIDVDIEDIEPINDNIGVECRTKFTFYLYADLKISIEIQYNNSSQFALMMCGLIND